MTDALDRLLAIMARLRDPEGGCPWDREQDFATIAPYTIEEAYEVADAIARSDMAALKDELGDLLFQVVFHARMAEEAGLFDFADVAAAISDKMVRRHPHVFGDAEIANAAAQTLAWEEHKAKERTAKAVASGARESVLDGVALALPALLRADKIQKRAARIGFDWPEARPVIAKLSEEIGELEAELAVEAGADHNKDRIEDEMGDILFAAANLARKLDIDPETALRRATEKFERRFRRVEVLAAERGIGPDLNPLDALWREVKSGEAKGDPISSTSADQIPSFSEPRRAEGISDNRVLRLERVEETLPTGFEGLRNEARAEGYKMLDRLATEWEFSRDPFRTRRRSSVRRLFRRPFSRYRRDHSGSCHSRRLPHAALLCRQGVSPSWDSASARALSAGPKGSCRPLNHRQCRGRQRALLGIARLHLGPAGRPHPYASVRLLSSMHSLNYHAGQLYRRQNNRPIAGQHPCRRAV